MRSPDGAVGTVLLLALLLAGCGADGLGGAASCVGPSVTLDPVQARVGDDVTVTVEWLHEGCNDHDGADEERALRDVPVSFMQGGTRVLLGTVSGTGERYTGSLAAPVPAEAAPGAAVIAVGGDGNTADLTVAP
jgi:hypothetical protein